jgi:hypothetical protein
VRTGRTIALGLVPLVLLLAAMLTLAPEHTDSAASQARAFEPSHRFRSVIFILDSAGKSEMLDPELMPFFGVVANVVSLWTIAVVRGEGDVSPRQKHLRRTRSDHGDDAPGFFGVRFQSDDLAVVAGRARNAARPTTP